MPQAHSSLKLLCSDFEMKKPHTVLQLVVVPKVMYILILSWVNMVGMWEIEGKHRTDIIAQLFEEPDNREEIKTNTSKKIVDKGKKYEDLHLKVM